MSLVAIPKLADLVAEPDKVALVPPEAIPAMRGELARLDSLLLARLLAGGNAKADSGPDGDRLLSAKEAAAKLGASEDYLYRRSRNLPFTVRMGRQVRFSETGIERYIRQRMGK
jgi:excisionase family DNA binding protein